MTKLTRINLAVMLDIIESDMETSTYGTPDYEDSEEMHFYAQRAVLRNQVLKMLLEEAYN